MPSRWCQEHMAVEVSGRQDARAVVDSLTREGIDHVKMVYDSTSPSNVKHLKTPYMLEIVETAHENDLRVYAHSMRMTDGRRAVQAGLDGLAHVPFAASVNGQRTELVEAISAEGVSAATTAIGLESLHLNGDEKTASDPVLFSRS